MGKRKQWVTGYPSWAGYGWRNPFLFTSTWSTKVGASQLREGRMMAKRRKEFRIALKGQHASHEPVGTPPTEIAQLGLWALSIHLSVLSPTPPPTLLLAPCAHSRVNLRKCVLVNREPTKKTRHYSQWFLTVSGKPQI